ncbi:MAG: GTP-binding protein EngB [Methanosarcinaceae archaeon]|nr:GTP-binding protein EngB [Methanosarcinaceae archaeon]NKQ39246.1 GTP-binding protein EngB [Methanosarcinales archaeon]
MKYVKDRFEIVLVGRSNVGKSTLMRLLTGKSVKVGRRPGVTLKPTSVCKSDLVLTDLPGFGFMSGVNEKRQSVVKNNIISYIEDNTDKIKLAVLVVDGAIFLDIANRWQKRNEIPIDIEFFYFLKELNIDIILAVNKADKIKNLNLTLDGIVECLGMDAPWSQWKNIVAPISAKKNDISMLKELIRDRLHKKGRDDLFKFV